MSFNQRKLISIIVPCFNEGDNTFAIYNALVSVVKNIAYNFELVFVDDGSTDYSIAKLKEATKNDSRVRIIEFSRNFGKEIALTAGINHCKGDACIMIDADFQHPPELIPEFIKKWADGAEVVVGVKRNNITKGIIRKFGSFMFYKIMSQISHTEITPYSTDFRLLDRIVINEFNKLQERNRITRGIIDWLGFKRDYIYFDANIRKNGVPSYSLTKLFRLAFSSFVSLSLFPLKLAGYLGICITIISGLLGLGVFIGKFIIRNPWTMSITGSAILALLILFLVGIILCCLGLTALYIAHIQIEVMGRPMYIVRRKR